MCSLLLPNQTFSVWLITGSSAHRQMTSLVTLAWLYIKPSADGGAENRSVTQSIAIASELFTSRYCLPVHSTLTSVATDGLILAHLAMGYKTLTVFTNLAYSLTWHKITHQPDQCHQFLMSVSARWGLSSPYHRSSLTQPDRAKQYDTSAD